MVVNKQEMVWLITNLYILFRLFSCWLMYMESEDLSVFLNKLFVVDELSQKKYFKTVVFAN